jgi:hypothetical protein
MSNKPADAGISMKKGPQKRSVAMNKLSKSQALQIIAHVCQRHGCEIRKVDLEQNILDLEGTDEAQEKCKQELEILLN